MSVLIPPAKNYQSPLISIPARWQDMPSEGARYMVAEIVWGTMGLPTGNNSAVMLNTAGQGAQTISQIVALSVDNSLSGADVVFIFPDSAQTYTVPAYTPLAVFPVFTGQTQFYVNAIGINPTDVTRLSIHNYMPPVMSIPTSQEQRNSGINGIVITGAGSTPIVAAGVGGTLESVSIQAAVTSATVAFNDGFNLIDGTGKLLTTSNFAGAINTTHNTILLNLTDVALRFQNGINLTQNGGFTPGGVLSVNLFYRTP